jgi:hypothetical protein
MVVMPRSASSASISSSAGSVRRGPALALRLRLAQVRPATALAGPSMKPSLCALLWMYSETRPARGGGGGGGWVGPGAWGASERLPVALLLPGCCPAPLPAASAAAARCCRALAASRRSRPSRRPAGPAGAQQAQQAPSRPSRRPAGPAGAQQAQQASRRRHRAPMYSLDGGVVEASRYSSSHVLTRDSWPGLQRVCFTSCMYSSSLSSTRLSAWCSSFCAISRRCACGSASLLSPEYLRMPVNILTARAQ